MKLTLTTPLTFPISDCRCSCVECSEYFSSESLKGHVQTSSPSFACHTWIQCEFAFCGNILPFSREVAKDRTKLSFDEHSTQLLESESDQRSSFLASQRKSCRLDSSSNSLRPEMLLRTCLFHHSQQHRRFLESSSSAGSQLRLSRFDGLREDPVTSC